MASIPLVACRGSLICAVVMEASRWFSQTSSRRRTTQAREALEGHERLSLTTRTVMDVRSLVDQSLDRRVGGVGDTDGVRSPTSLASADE